MKPPASSFAIALVAAICCHGVLGENMNGPHYRIANSDAFEADYSNEREFFVVYSNPIRSLYSQVHWTAHGDIPLPPDIVNRFAGGKAMAITGYEVDQVMLNSAGEEVSVPITWAYNHHYCAYILNSKTTKMVMTDVDESMERLGMNHGASSQWMAQVLDKNAHDLPQVHFFSEGNGGEMRMSYHGYPPGYAQVLQSPDTFHIVPMQIDTWNRNMKNSSFLPGPMPRESKIPASAGYNGLLECPCTDRLPKKLHMTYQIDNDENSPCVGPIHNASECFLASQTVLASAGYKYQTVNDESLPTGCSASLDSDGTLTATWNTAESSLVFENADQQHVVGAAVGVVNMTLNLKASESMDAVQITLTGPADAWFGVGFGADRMCIDMESDECPMGGPYAIVVYDDHVEERKLGFHGPGTVLSTSVEVVSNKVANGIRTIHLTRKLQGDSDDDYTFDPSQPSIEVILATGCSKAFAQHCGHGASHVTLLPVKQSVELCQAGIKGTIGGASFNKKCAPYPRSDLVNQQNPTCWVQTYQGGLSCCRHNHFLLDQDQEVPWSDQTLEYRLKFRFYFEEFKSHKNLVRFYMQTEAFAGEYDVPQCVEGTPPSQCVHVISSRLKVIDLLDDCSTIDSSYCTGEGSRDEEKTAGIQLIYAGPHCHAPSCLSMELYNGDTGELLCHVEPIFGKSQDVFDEKGYLAIPPCLWGNSADGLTEPLVLPLNTTLLSIKRNNSTLPHTGEMASWQMRGVVVSREDIASGVPSSSRIVAAEDASRPYLRSSMDDNK